MKMQYFNGKFALNKRNKNKTKKFNFKVKENISLLSLFIRLYSTTMDPNIRMALIENKKKIKVKKKTSKLTNIKI